MIKIDPVKQAAIVKASQDLENLKYLADTDWYVIREMDIGQPVPPEIKANRQAARDALNLVD